MSDLQTLLSQAVFLFTGVFSTCAAQFVFYQGAGDHHAMLLPLCNYLGMMLVGLIPTSAPAQIRDSSSNSLDELKQPQPQLSLPAASGEPSSESSRPLAMELTHRPNAVVTLDTTVVTVHQYEAEPTTSDNNNSSSSSGRVSCSVSTVQLCIGLSVFLDFAGCIFSNLGLSMAGSGLYQVVYSSVICWSALFSRVVLQKIVSSEQWIGIALVTFGLAFSALGESASSSNQDDPEEDGKHHYLVLMGCLNTLIGAAFYGGNYVTGEFTLHLPERPQAKQLCLTIGTTCVAIIAVYQSIFVLPRWRELVAEPIAQAEGNTVHIMLALVAYTVSQLAHGLTYFMILGSSGAVTTGIMQSLRAVCVFLLSSVLYCGQQESQCFDTKRGVATLLVVIGVLFYSWAKSRANKSPGGIAGGKMVPLPPMAVRALGAKTPKIIAGKNYVV